MCGKESGEDLSFINPYGWKVCLCPECWKTHKEFDDKRRTIKAVLQGSLLHAIADIMNKTGESLGNIEVSYSIKMPKSEILLHIYQSGQYTSGGESVFNERVSIGVYLQ